MSKHTPGPWGRSAALSSDSYSIRYISGPDAEDIAVIRQKLGMSQEEALANAKLIAAAPDLLDAAQEAKRMYKALCPTGGWQGVFEMLEAAIKKATK